MILTQKSLFLFGVSFIQSNKIFYDKLDTYNLAEVLE